MNWLCLVAPVVGEIVEVMFPAQLGTEDNCASDPMVPGDAIFEVPALDARALASQIVEELAAQADEVVRLQLPVRVIEDRPLRCVASELGRRLAPGAVGIGYQ